jgi:tetratricopeptide (TPR) repeat protein
MVIAHVLKRDSQPASFRSLGERFLDYALKVQSEAADAHLLKAWYLHDRRETEQAIDSTRRALAVDPNYAKAWAGLGFFHLESNRFAEAKSAFNRALDLYPGCPQRQTIVEIISGIEQNLPLTTAQNNNL